MTNFELSGSPLDRLSARGLRRFASGLVGWCLALAGLGLLVGLDLGESPTDAEDGTGGPNESAVRSGPEPSASPIWALAYSPDGAYLASATVGGDVRVRCVATGCSATLQRGGSSSARSLVFSPDSRTLAVLGSANPVRLYEVETGTERTPVCLGQEPVYFAAFLDGGSRLLAGTWEGSLSVWDLKANRRVSPHETAATRMQALSVAPGGGLVAWGDSLGTLVVLGTDLEVRWASNELPPAAVRALVFAPNAALVAMSRSLESSVRVFDAATGNPLYVADVGVLGARHLAFSPDGKLLALLGIDGLIRLVNAGDGRPLATFKMQRTAYALAFSPEGSRLSTAGVEGWIKDWDVGGLLARR